MIVKATGERLIFEEFVHRALLDISPDTIESRDPPEPDIHCATRAGEPLAFELGEICAAELARDLVELGRNADRKPAQRWPGDPTEAMYQKKIAKSYSAVKTSLLLYTDGRTTIPDDIAVKLSTPCDEYWERFI